MDAKGCPQEYLRMTAPEYWCRLCNSRDDIAVGKSRLGIRFYACAGCSVVFMEPATWSRQAQEQITPSLAHLFVAHERRQADATFAPPDANRLPVLS